LTPEALGGDSHAASFELRREAGTFVCRGTAGGGRGKGDFRFDPDPDYASAVAAAGVRLTTVRDHVKAAVFDVSSSFVRAIVAIGLPSVRFADLCALGGLGVAPEDVAGLSAAFPGEDLGDFVSLAMIGVTPAYVEALRRANVDDLSIDNVAALRASGVDQAFIEGLAADGRRGLSIDDVVSLYG
jgi:hypothetical protein